MWDCIARIKSSIINLKDKKLILKMENRCTPILPDDMLHDTKHIKNKISELEDILDELKNINNDK